MVKSRVLFLLLLIGVSLGWKELIPVSIETHNGFDEGPSSSIKFILELSSFDKHGEWKANRLQEMKVKIDELLSVRVSDGTRNRSALNSPFSKNIKNVECYFHYHQQNSFVDSKSFKCGAFVAMSKEDLNTTTQFMFGVIKALHFEISLNSSQGDEWVETSKELKGYNKLSRLQQRKQNANGNKEHFVVSEVHVPRDNEMNGKNFAIYRASQTNIIRDINEGVQYKRHHEIIQSPPNEKTSYSPQMNVIYEFGSPEFLKETVKPSDLKSPSTSLFGTSKDFFQKFSEIWKPIPKAMKSRNVPMNDLMSPQLSWTQTLWEKSWCNGNDCTQNQNTDFGADAKIQVSLFLDKYSNSLNLTGQLDAALTAYAWGNQVTLVEMVTNMTFSFDTQFHAFHNTEWTFLSFSSPSTESSSGSIQGSSSTCTPLSSIEDFKYQLFTKELQFFSATAEILAAGFVPVEVSVGLGGSIELDIAFLGCKDDSSDPHGIVFLQLNGQISGTGSVGIGSQWIQSAGAEVQVEFIGGVIQGGSDWDINTLSLSNPWPTCLGGNFTLNGFDTRIYLYTSGFFYNAKKIIAEFPAQVLASTYALSCQDINPNPPPTPPPVVVPWDPNSPQVFANCPPRTSDAIWADCTGSGNCTNLLYDNNHCGSDCSSFNPACDSGFNCFGGYCVRQAPNPENTTYTPMPAASVSSNNGDILTPNSQLTICLVPNNGNPPDCNSQSDVGVIIANGCLVNGENVVSYNGGNLQNCEDENGNEIVGSYQILYNLSPSSPSFGVGQLTIECSLMDGCPPFVGCPPYHPYTPCNPIYAIATQFVPNNLSFNSTQTK